MRLLAILWAEEPTAEDWQRLSAARTALGYTDLIQPAQALPGSPGPVLAIGKLPSWIVPHAYVASTEHPRLLQEALETCINGGLAEIGENMAAQMSDWMDASVTYLGEEEYDGGVQFS